MIKLVDIYKSVNGLLFSKYPKDKYKIYGHEVVEGFDTPSFFVDLVPRAISNESVNFTKNAYTIMITYFQPKANEIDNLIKADEIKMLFGYKLTINDRKIPITDFTYDFAGKNRNVLQISVDIEYLEDVEKVDNHKVATELIMKEEVNKHGNA